MVKQWDNRIVGHGEENPNELIANPLNWRLHPQAQENALASILSDIGTVQSVIVNKTTGRLVDGHFRVELARKKKIKSIPVVYVELTEEEEKKVLATLDPLSGMAETDTDMLKSLISDFDKNMADVVSSTIDDFQLIDMSNIPSDTKEDQMAELIKFENRGIQKNGYHQKVIFDSKNQYGIPDYKDDMLSDVIPEKVWSYKNYDVTKGKTLFVFRDLGSSRLPDVNGEILAFYCDDERFEKVWNSAVNESLKLKNQGWGTIITPDFSLWRGLPWIENVWNLYKSYWCGRYWQEIGIKIIPSLNWADESTHDIAFSGIPKNTPVVSCQCQTTRTKRGKYYFISGLQAAIDLISPGSVLIYGGVNHRKWIEPNLKAKCNIVYLESRVQHISKRGAK